MDLKCVRKPTKSRLTQQRTATRNAAHRSVCVNGTEHTMQTNSAVERNKSIRWSENPWNQSGRKGKSLRRKGFAEEPSLEFRMKH